MSRNHRAGSTRRALFASLATASGPCWLLAAIALPPTAPAAAANLAAVDASWDIIENGAYHRLLLLYRGDLDAQALLAAEADRARSR